MYVYTCYEMVINYNGNRAHIRDILKFKIAWTNVTGKIKPPLTLFNIKHSYKKYLAYKTRAFVLYVLLHRSIVFLYYTDIKPVLRVIRLVVKYIDVFHLVCSGMSADAIV